MRVAYTAVASLFALCAEARAEWIVSLYTGSSWSRHSDLRVVQPPSNSDATFGDVHWDARPFEDAPYYGLRVAYFANSSPRFGGTFDYTHYKMYAQTQRVTAVRGLWNGGPVNEAASLATRVQTLEISHGVNLASLNAEYRWPEVGRWSAHIGGGVVGYWPHAEGTINALSVGADYHLAGGGAQVFAGGEYRLARHLGLLIQGKAEAGKLDIDLAPQTRLVTHTHTLHALTGISLHFSPQ